MFQKVKILKPTCVSVKDNSDENSARSEIDKYCFSRNLFSRLSSCSAEKGVRGFRSRLCRRKVTESGAFPAGCSPSS